MCELAFATNTLPSQWEGEDEAAIATILELFEQRAEG